MLQDTFKQAAIKALIKKIYPEVTVQFDMSNRTKRRYATCWPAIKRIKFYKPLFAYDLNSCLHCALHEIAHLMQWEMTGRTAHNRGFAEIKDMLISDYGSKEICKSKKNKQRAWSVYSLDRKK